MIRKLGLLAAGAMLASYSVASSSAILFFDNQAAFDAQVAAATLTSLGTEDFESSNLAPSSIQQFLDPLLPGVANGPFTSGTAAALGITVQTNTGGGAATDNDAADTAGTAIRGGNNLVTASAGFFGTPSDQVSVVTVEDSLDLLFAPLSTEPLVAVSLAPLFFDSVTFDPNATSTIIVEVFDAAGVFLGDTSVLNVDYGANTALEFLGIFTTAGDDIGRINLSDGNLQNHQAGVDNISLFAAPAVVPPQPAPAPGSVLLLAAGIAALGVRRRRARPAR